MQWGFDPFYSPVNQERLRKAAAEMDAGDGTVHELADTEDRATAFKISSCLNPTR
jgi:hypothetical protein